MQPGWLLLVNFSLAPSIQSPRLPGSSLSWDLPPRPHPPSLRNYTCFITALSCSATDTWTHEFSACFPPSHPVGLPLKAPPGFREVQYRSTECFGAVITGTGVAVHTTAPPSSRPQLSLLLCQTHSPLCWVDRRDQSPSSSGAFLSATNGVAALLLPLVRLLGIMAMTATGTAIITGTWYTVAGGTRGREFRRATVCRVQF